MSRNGRTRRSKRRQEKQLGKAVTTTHRRGMVAAKPQSYQAPVSAAPVHFRIS